MPKKTRRYEFPDLKGIPSEKTPEGMVALGADLRPETLIDAYRHGIFPWPIGLPDGSSTGEGDFPLTWFSPDPRAILEFSRIHIPKSLKRALNRAQANGLRFTVDEAFDSVIEACSKVPRPGQRGTWIIPSLLDAYRVLHREGFAHSAEVWSGTALVGGIYGVAVDGAFCGESMFHHETNASKFALLHLVEHLASRGLDWIDIQTMTPHLEALGASLISRDAFLEKLAATRAQQLRLF